MPSSKNFMFADNAPPNTLRKAHDIMFRSRARLSIDSITNIIILSDTVPDLRPVLSLKSPRSLPE